MEIGDPVASHLIDRRPRAGKPREWTPPNAQDAAVFRFLSTMAAMINKKAASRMR